MNKKEYAFLKRHIDIGNCGQHDLDNSFLRGRPRTFDEIKKHRSGGLIEEFGVWQEDHPGCMPIGICKENTHNIPGMHYVAMVYEDERGGRYYVHVPGYWIPEYEAFDQGENAMGEARDKFWEDCGREDFGRVTTPTEEELDAVEKSDLSRNFEAGQTEKPAEEKKSEDAKSKTKAIKAYFTCDALHTLETAYKYMREEGEIGIALGLRYVFEQLQRIAERAAELDDPQLHISMLKLHLYDVEDVNSKINEMNERINNKKQED